MAEENENEIERVDPDHQCPVCLGLRNNPNEERIVGYKSFLAIVKRSLKMVDDGSAPEQLKGWIEKAVKSYEETR